MATITLVAPNVYEAEFNRSRWRIVRNSDKLSVYRLWGSQWKPVKQESHKVRSLLRFYSWHMRSERESSELPTMFAVADGVAKDG